jgi:hypothetical protein
MAQTSWPFEGVNTNETQFSLWAKNLTPGGRGGVIGVPGDTTLKVTGSSSGMQVSVALGNAIVRGFFFQSTAAETLTIGTSSTSPRIDSVVVRLNPTSNTIVLAVVQGTPAATPVAPTLTQTESGNFELLLATVAVAANVTTIAAGDVTDLRTFNSNVWTTVTRPANQLGLIGFNTTTGKLEQNSGSAWSDVVPSTFTASQVSDPLNLNVGKVNGSKFSVQATAPSSPTSGDIWFW